MCSLVRVPSRGVDPVLKVGEGRGTNLYRHIFMHNIYIYMSYNI